MRGLLLASLALALLLPRIAAADEQADARAILEKAIRAMGDERVLAKIKTLHYKVDSRFYSHGQAIPLRLEVFLEGHDKERSIISDDKGDFVNVVNGNDGWIKHHDGVTTTMTEAQVASSRQMIYVDWVRWLVLCRKPDYRLSPLDEIKVEGRNVVGLLVRSEKHDAVKLYFDKEKYLLSKCELRYMDVESGRESHSETVYSDYRSVRGVKCPFKTESFRNDEKKVESVCQLIEFSEKPFDDKLFAKP